MTFWQWYFLTGVFCVSLIIGKTREHFLLRFDKRQRVAMTIIMVIAWPVILFVMNDDNDPDGFA